MGVASSIRRESGSQSDAVLTVVNRLFISTDIICIQLYICYEILYQSILIYNYRVLIKIKNDFLNI